jgi:hypothetical protein
VSETVEKLKITKKLLDSLVDEYINDAIDKPPSQSEPRFSECFDKSSIVDELYLSLKDVENIKTVPNLRRLVRFMLQVSEEHANMFKRVRVISEDVAYASDEIAARVPARSSNT